MRLSHRGFAPSKAGFTRRIKCNITADTGKTVAASEFWCYRSNRPLPWPRYASCSLAVAMLHLTCLCKTGPYVVPRYR